MSSYFFQIVAAVSSVGNYGAVSDGSTDDAAALNTALQNNDVIYFEPNTVTAVGSAVVIPSNKTLIFGNNSELKLLNGASDYILRNEDFVNGNEGITIIAENQNARINGNKVGGQTRDYSTNSLDPNSYWGFGMWFVRVKNLQIKNLTVKDTEAWGIAHYDCTGIIENIHFDQATDPGANGDGVTGFSGNITIRNISGYTNDDLIFIGAGGGSVESNDMGLPPITIDNVVIENIRGESKNGNDCWRGVRVSGRENQRIKNITVRNVKGDFQYEAVEIANFWATNGNLYIDNITVEDIKRNSKAGNPQSTIFIDQVIIDNISVKDVRINPEVSEDPIKIGQNATIETISFDNINQTNEIDATIPIIKDFGSTRLVKLDNCLNRNRTFTTFSGALYVRSKSGFYTKIKMSNSFAYKANDNKFSKAIDLVSGFLSVNGTSDFVDTSELTPEPGDLVLDINNGLQYYNGSTWS